MVGRGPPSGMFVELCVFLIRIILMALHYPLPGHAKTHSWVNAHVWLIFAFYRAQYIFLVILEGELLSQEWVVLCVHQTRTILVALCSLRPALWWRLRQICMLNKWMFTAAPFQFPWGSVHFPCQLLACQVRFPPKIWVTTHSFRSATLGQYMWSTFHAWKVIYKCCVLLLCIHSSLSAVFTVIACFLWCVLGYPAFFQICLGN